MVPVSMTLTAL